MEDSLSGDESCSVDSVTIEEIVEMVIDDRLCYLCKTSDGTDEIFDRSDLMDDGVQQRMVLQFERKNPPPWDKECPACGLEGCEECECADCDRTCRFLFALNYGCPCHPVI
jgi:hypothetical protein